MYSVLTGDIVQSRKLDMMRLKQVMETLRSSVNEFNEYFPGTVVAGQDVFRGDGWQTLIGNPAQALRLALFLRARLKSGFGVDTAVSIGIGTVDRIEESHISESSGKAFEVSGRGMERMKKRQRLFIAGEEDLAWPDEGERITMLLIDSIVQKWTNREAYAVAGALLGKSQESIAEDSPVTKTGNKPSRQSVADSLDRASWIAIKEYLEFFIRRLQAI
jgi:hypothetical protein